MIKNNQTLIVAKKELSSLFNSPIAYIVIAAFLALTGFLFFTTFFLYDQAEMRAFFQLMPILFSIFVPAITMRAFAEEQNTGTLEMLMTLPIQTRQAVLGKFWAATAFIALMLAPTLFYLVSIRFLGRPDPGPIAGGYIGTLFLGAAYAAMGIFASSLTKSQIVAFIITACVTLFFTFLNSMLLIVPAGLVNTLEFIGTEYHFRNISRGVLDSRSLIYLGSLAAFFLLATIKQIESRR